MLLASVPRVCPELRCHRYAVVNKGLLLQADLLLTCITRGREQVDSPPLFRDKDLGPPLFLVGLFLEESVEGSRPHPSTPAGQGLSGYCNHCFCSGA